jgi:hypothetical protein
MIGSSRAEPLTVSAAVNGGSLQIAGSESTAHIFGLRDSIEHLVIGCIENTFLDENWQVGLL